MRRHLQPSAHRTLPVTLVSIEHRLRTEEARQAHRAHSHGAIGTVAEVQSSAMLIQLAVLLEDRALVVGHTKQLDQSLDLIRLTATHEAPLMLLIALLAALKWPLPIQTFQAPKTRKLTPETSEVAAQREGRVRTSLHTIAGARQTLAIGLRERHRKPELAGNRKAWGLWALYKSGPYFGGGELVFVFSIFVFSIFVFAIFVFDIFLAKNKNARLHKSAQKGVFRLTLRI